MAVETVASVVIQKLTDILTEKPISNQKVIVGHLVEIKKTLEEMSGYFLDAEHQNDESVKRWTEEYVTCLYKIEDTIESFALRIARRRISHGFLRNPLLTNCAPSRMLSRKIQKIRVKIECLNNERPKGLQDASPRFAVSSSFPSHVRSPIASPSPVKTPAHEGGEEQGETKFKSVRDTSIARDRYKQANLMYSSSYLEEELDIVGFKEQVDAMVERLTDESADAGGVVPILGDMGSGKTILARAVYGNRGIKESFERRAWVTASRGCDVRNLLRNLLKHVGGPEDNGVRIEEQLLKARLRKRLKDSKYFIVLDDVRSPDIWEALKGALPNNTNGSIVLLITREKELVTAVNGTPFTMKEMSDEHSRDLFLRKAGWEKAVLENDQRTQRILQACSRLPLNVILLGSFLSAKKGAKDLQGWIEELSTQESWKTNEILSLCYDDLTHSLKLCLLYMLLFPPELDIPVRRLLRLWQAEGFVTVKRPDEANNFQEDVAKEYFDDLVNRSLIQVSKLRSDGSPRSCRLLGVLHDHLPPKVRGIRLFHVHRENSNECDGEGSFDVRRLVEYRDSSRCSFYHSKRKECLRSFLSFNDQKKDIPAKEVRNLLSKIIGNGKPLLRVLDLEGLYKPSLPENLGDFFHLRYLGLRWTFLDTLPQSVGELYYLETLDVKHTNIKTLPTSIWKLKHLRHLNLNDIRLDIPRNMPSSLPELLTLWGLSVDQESLVEGGLDSLVYLRELGVTLQLSDSKQLLEWISKLKTLQQLRLRSRDDMGNPSDLFWKPLSDLNQLSFLYLLGKLSKLPNIGDFPSGIKVLTFSVSHLGHDPMPILGQLPSLTVLRLLANSYLGDEISCKAGGFPKLQVLKLWNLENLEKWVLEERAMEGLKELNIRRCNKLRSIPSRLLQQEKFKELILTNMPEELEAQVKQEKSHHIYVTVKNYFG